MEIIFIYHQVIYTVALPRQCVETHVREQPPPSATGGYRPVTCCWPPHDATTNSTGENVNSNVIGYTEVKTLEGTAGGNTSDPPSSTARSRREGNRIMTTTVDISKKEKNVMNQIRTRNKRT